MFRFAKKENQKLLVYSNPILNVNVNMVSVMGQAGKVKKLQ